MLQHDAAKDHVVATGQNPTIGDLVQAACDYVGLDPADYVVTDGQRGADAGGRGATRRRRVQGQRGCGLGPADRFSSHDARDGRCQSGALSQIWA